MILSFPASVNTPDDDAADAELVLCARQGTLSERHTAYTVLVTRYQGFVRSMLLGLTRQPALADDLTQDTFLTAWQKLNTLVEPQKFGGWLKQLAYRHFLHSYRRKQTEQKHLPEAGDVVIDTQDIVDTDAELNELLALCTPLEREIMVLCYGFEFTLKEVAESRGMALGTVKSHVHRAKHKMQQKLEQAQTGRVETGSKKHG
ncbi:MAG: RNA polymerase sigma factor [Pseudomonadaceae bacterium]|nr:RNA polymerase sigma factor [Pseudomonadaceae bacterium]